MNSKRRLCLWLLVLSLALFLFGCAAKPSVAPTAPPPAQEKPTVDVTAAVRATTWNAYEKVLKEVAESQFPVDPVMARQQWVGKEAGFLVVDLRSAQDYAQKHVKGAVNLSIVGLAENLAHLPKDKKLLLYCYTGQSSALAMVPLKAHGYEAIFVNGGFGQMEQAGFPMDTAGVAFAPAKNPSVTDVNQAAVLAGIRSNLLAIARQHRVKTLVVPDADVKELVSGSPEKYAFVDLRPVADYAKGHVKGAINAPLAELKTRLPQLPKEKRLILCCKSGQLAAMATAPLTAEGFKIISLCAGLLQAEKGPLPWEK